MKRAIIAILVAAAIILTAKLVSNHDARDQWNEVRLTRDSLVIDSLSTQLGWYQNEWQESNDDNEKVN